MKFKVVPFIKPVILAKVSGFMDLISYTLEIEPDPEVMDLMLYKNSFGSKKPIGFLTHLIPNELVELEVSIEKDLKIFYLKEGDGVNKPTATLKFNIPKGKWKISYPNNKAIVKL